ncbi:MAG: CopG family transcriptional regulator [Planctomycetes bacterium RBG_13_62_9]|nr:MAG: CopG family transcriptional regulator [Planctomycetes bacterium RBG_13_62_9]
MRTVQMTLDEELLASVDRAAKKLKTTRSAFTRKALREALDRLTISEMEHKHRRGYKRKPVRRGEFDVWEKEQAWGDS